jgi:DNA-binding response OmpR family regulator
VKVLLIEDDRTTELMLKKALTSHHYAVDVAGDGELGLEMADTYEYDILLMDVGVPKIDGLQLCQTLRKQGCQTPILLLTAKDARNDRVLGLDAGADDYLVKPFDLPELLARIRALLRRGGTERSPVLMWEHLKLDPSTGEIRYEDQPLRLTPKEAGIVELLLRNPQRIFSRGVILDKLWDIAESPGEETVTTHIKGLRHKLTAAGAPKDLIEAMYGLGYRLNPLLQHPLTQSAIESNLADSTADTLKQMAGLWEKFKDTFTAQIQQIEVAAQALANQCLTPKLRHQAEREAHKLAGSMGMFGFDQGSVLAQEIEQLLKTAPTLTSKQIQRLNQLVRSLWDELKQGPRIQQPEMPVYKGSLASVLVVDDDPVLTEQIRLQAPIWNFQATVITSPGAALETIAQTSPDIILLDLSFPDSDTDGFQLLEDLTHRDVNIPVVILSGRNSLTDRVEVARSGASAYLEKPLTCDRIFQTLRQTLQNHQPYEASEGKILIVDDDRVILESLRTLLEPWGLHIITLEDPQQFWQGLNRTQPDLLLLDVEMPAYSGLELCQVVRNDPRWETLPILFLTAHTEAVMIHQAFAAGGDDYIRKPIIEAEVVARILSRLRRKQRLS